jgi:hypothetical protein
MQSVQDLNPSIGPTRLQKPSRIRPAIVAGALAAASLAATACGSQSLTTHRTARITILNTQKVDRAIERAALVQRGKRAHVSCPSGVHQQRGLTFSCTAVVGRTSTRFVVTELDGSGDVHYVAR